MAGSNLHGGIQGRKCGPRLAERRVIDRTVRDQSVARLLLGELGGKQSWPEAETGAGVARPSTEEEPLWPRITGRWLPATPTGAW